MAELAGEDPEDTIIPLLEGTIAFLCIPRKNPPGGPSVIEMEAFDGGVSRPATKKNVASLRAACVAAVAAKAKKSTPKINAEAKAKKRTGKQPRSMAAASGGIRAAISPLSRSPTRHRSASPPANALSSSRRKLQTAASAAKGRAAKRAAAAVSAKLAKLLLPWDTNSLTSLLSAHKALAAILLRLEQSSRLAADSATKENQRSSMPDTTTDTESMDADDHSDGTGDQHYRPQSNQSTELLKRADASLTAALAAAGRGVRPVTPPFYTGPNTAGSFPEAAGIGSKTSEAGITPTFGGGPSSPPWPPSSPSRLSTPLNTASDDERGPLKGAAERRSPTCIPATTMVRDADANHKMTDLDERNHSPPEPQGEAATAPSSPPGGVESDNSWLPRQKKRVQQPRPRRGRGGDTTTGGDGSLLATIVADADRKTVAELYGMRCAAKEGLGLTGDAFKDCRAALAIVPGAPKLWAKAASLALQLGSDADRGDERSGEAAPSKAFSSSWAREVRDKKTISGFNETGALGQNLKAEGANRGDAKPREVGRSKVFCFTQ